MAGAANYLDHSGDLGTLRADGLVGATMNLGEFDAARSIDHQPFHSACYAPFVGLSFDPYGTVSVCSFTRASPIGRIGSGRSLEEMWVGAAAGDLRAAVRDGDLGRWCSRCAEEIAGGNLHGVLAKGFDQFTAQPDAPRPTRIEFALTTVCNLQCVMCSGEFSSMIRSRREGLPALPMRYGPEFLDELRPFLPGLDQARFLGGEPFLAEINFQIWELLIEMGCCPDVNVTTNGTQWNARIERILEELPFSIGVSIDGFRPETVEAIRSGASHPQIMETLAHLIRYRDRRGTSLSLTFCLMRENWQEFGDFLVFAEGLGCAVYVNTVRQPPAHSLYRLDREALGPILDRLEVDRDRVGQQLSLNRDVWNEQIDRLQHHRSDLVEAGPPIPEAARWEDLVGRLAGADEDVTRALLAASSVDGDVSTIRCDLDDRVSIAERYVGMDVGHVVGHPSAEVLELLAARYGQRVDIVAERVGRGVVARVVSFGDDVGRASLIASVTRRGPSPHGTTRLGALLAVNGRSAPVYLASRRK